MKPNPDIDQETGLVVESGAVAQPAAPPPTRKSITTKGVASAVIRLSAQYEDTILNLQLRNAKLEEENKLLVKQVVDALHDLGKLRAENVAILKYARKLEQAGGAARDA